MFPLKTIYWYPLILCKKWGLGMFEYQLMCCNSWIPREYPYFLCWIRLQISSPEVLAENMYCFFCSLRTSRVIKSHHESSWYIYIYIRTYIEHVQKCALNSLRTTRWNTFALSHWKAQKRQPCGNWWSLIKHRSYQRRPSLSIINHH